MHLFTPSSACDRFACELLLPLSAAEPGPVGPLLCVSTRDTYRVKRADALAPAKAAALKRVSLQVESSHEANAEVLREMTRKLYSQYEDKLQEEQQRHSAEKQALLVRRGAEDRTEQSRVFGSVSSLRFKHGGGQK